MQFDGDMQVVVQPGIRQRELNTLLAPKGIFFPVDPGSNPTLGGMVLRSTYLFPIPQLDFCMYFFISCSLFRFVLPRWVDEFL